jgi:carbonic anhydrase
MQLMAPAADKAGPRGDLSSSDYLTRLEQANIVNSLDNLMTFPLLRKMIERGQVAVHGAYFGVATGALLVRDATSGAFVPVAADEHARALTQPRC